VSEKLNYFTTAGYSRRTNEGGGKQIPEYFNVDDIKNHLDEDQRTEKNQRWL
jgi:hypothetical protein